MSSQKINVRTLVLILMLVAVAAMRIVNVKYTLLSNFTPVGAIALFGGAYFTDKWKAYLLVFATLLFSDVVINYIYTQKLILFYSGSLRVYFCFMVMVLIGSLIKNANIANVLLASLVSVLFHWLFLELPWFYGTTYPHTIGGYGESLIAAIPFEQKMILGDIIYCGLLFGGFELAKSKYAILRSNRELAV